MPPIHILRLQHVPIYEQLQLEEALLRADDRNWCILNEGAPPAIVMGISGKPEQLINLTLLQQAPIPVIRRFSGGGTVVVDKNTLFATFICNNVDTELCGCPEKIHRWTEKIYKQVFPTGFALRENDYVIGERKFGGNAQYLRKDRWLHHSTLLWDYTAEHMEYLCMPPKMPQYRQARNHDDFLCRLKDHHDDKELLKAKLIHALTEIFAVKETTWEQINSILKMPHRKATELIDKKLLIGG